MSEPIYHLPQERRLVTELPGPRSRELAVRRDAVVARGVSSSSPFYVKEADGGVLVDADGNSVIDLGAGIAVTSVGASAPKVVANVQEAVARFTHTSFATTPYEGYIEVCEKLAELTPGDFPKKSVLVNSGAEAVENAVKIARHYTGRAAVAVAENAFHGRTNLTMALTSKAMPYKAGFGPFAPEIYHFPSSYPYREPAPISGEDAAKRAIDYLETTVGFDKLACLLQEPIQGEGGFIVPAPGYLETLQAWCRANGIVFILDEIQCGFCRSGRWFASEYDGVEPDLITTAKALGGGLPLAAVTGRAEIVDSAQAGGLGGTYGGNPVSCAASLGAIETMKEWDLPARARAIEAAIRAKVEPLVGHNGVGDLRGRGAMMAVEFVEPGSTKPDSARAGRIAKALLAEGVVVLTCGIHGNCIRFLPSLTIPAALLDEALDLFVQAVAA
ncbi:MAG: 4-aminobutyrate--2-oxoglutarate transaminase [Acidipropionibacterium acidipropionici]|jgi:4-aminobutyrate aminotransferase/(S)-3-amino-2-methylpropionate transaminase|uniref:4-aminobutyrate--2-oxoglutarate transaminase n=1 Tax=Acidipropionibacterium acidipropionici TaxID=1748 RepID=UPI002657A825|nr:4-aminobutyrate--2-oxoglutarate transaminase [Acidipropionibacterium acidipropionici]